MTFPKTLRSLALLAGATLGVAALAVPRLAAIPSAFAEEAPHLVPAPEQPMPQPMPQQTGLQQLTVSGGCFWGVQGVFEHVRGVRKAVSGYTGGSAATAQYETVSGGDTGHAESVQITYDPSVVSEATLLRIFFSVALDPTRLNAQGPDTGTQYRSEIWYASPAQAQAARAYIAQLDASHSFGAPIRTRVDPLHGFYPAERYHQDYLILHPDAAYIVYNDLPKVEALRRLFPEYYVSKPVTVLASAS
ncbi:peptide-methionine (S)-S-oxide reductase MsrA [Acetobacteraceae bacterium KSS8]|uniref:Peptide methionine sulfoxide reductase MsrA n=1 Tax=Endosaccharibacter trunci TaxID=2812733 RepID=A0ABT1W3H2_9PROT|nr:peptide-methionine (S)-S-oxide reductase MsrA [Acetobacteraceae bacterium KSS8]